MTDAPRKPLKAWRKERHNGKPGYVLFLGAMTIHVLCHKRRWRWETYQNGFDWNEYKTRDEAKIGAEDFIREVLEDTMKTLNGETE